jgi:hypothetical protein
MRGYFERLERNAYVHWWQRLFGNRRRHGYGGWLTTSLPDATVALHDEALLGEIVSAARSELRSAVEGLSRIEDYHRYLRTWLDPNDWRVAGGSLRGLWLVPLATAHGRRNGTRERIQRAAAERHGHLVVEGYPEDALTSQTVETAVSTVARHPGVREQTDEVITFDAPEGTVTIDGDNQHTFKKVRIGKVREDGLIDTIWSTDEAVKPDPYLCTYDWAAALPKPEEGCPAPAFRELSQLARIRWRRLLVSALPLVSA